MDRDDMEWVTQVLVPWDGVIEVNIRYRLQPGTGLGMVQAEIKDPSTRELLGLWSRPAGGYEEARAHLEAAAAWTTTAVDLLVNPDPF